MKRAFGVEIEACARCGGKLAVIASIEEPRVIAKLLSHLQRTAPQQYPSELPLGVRAPPVHAWPQGRGQSKRRSTADRGCMGLAGASAAHVAGRTCRAWDSAGRLGLAMRPGT